jgi:hypothetical protein
LRAQTGSGIIYYIRGQNRGRQAGAKPVPPRIAYSINRTPKGKKIFFAMLFAPNIRLE